MKKLWYYLKHHLREDFRLGQYLSVALLLVICITFNYTVDFEDSVLDRLTGFTKFVSYLAFYAIPYFLTALLFAFFSRKRVFLREKGFWLTAFFGLCIMSLDSSLPFLFPIIQKTFAVPVQYWMYKVAVNGISFITVFLPIVLFYVFFEKDKRDVYGLAPKKFDAKPYLLMLLIMLPLLIAASTTAGFQKQYPMYKTSAAHTYLGVSEWLTAAAYETAYGLDFVTVELLFRGFFVLAIGRYLGRAAVLNMAVIYCLLHFGKPMGEAISSIFGGFILGVFAYETRSIWGGVIVHMGIAWMMELIAFIEKSF